MTTNNKKTKKQMSSSCNNNNNSNPNNTTIKHRLLLVLLQKWREINNYSINKRYVVAGLLCIGNAICYGVRMNISIAIPYFIVSDKSERGLILSSFFYGYICTQILAGFWAQRYGAHKVLATAVAIWTICDVSTIFVAANNTQWLLLVLARIGTGLGEGVTMSCLHIFAAYWFPHQEQSTLVAVVSSGSDLGTILALLLSNWILKVTGYWQSIFLQQSLIATIWLFFFIKLVSSTPEEHPTISSQECDMIVKTRRRRRPQTMTTKTTTVDNNDNDNNHNHHDTEQEKMIKKQIIVPWKTILTNRYLWVIYTSHFCSNYSWYVLLGWLPTYLQEHLDLDLRQNPLVAALPYICGYMGLLVAGKLSDYLITRRGMSVLRVRRFMGIIGSLGPALALWALPYYGNSSNSAIGLLSICMLTGRANMSSFWINMIDIGPEYAGQIMGVSNTVATIPGIVGNLITGYILQQSQGNWTKVFHVASLVSVIGGIVFSCFSTDRNIFSGKSDKTTTDMADELEKEPFLDSK